MLLRHWQWGLMACLLIPGLALASIFQETVTFLAAAVAPGQTIGAYFVSGAIVIIVSVFWVLPQAGALSGGGFMGYVSTLPVSRRMYFGIDAALLLVADVSILMIAAFALGAMPEPFDPFRFGALAVLLGLAVLAQRIVVMRCYWGLAGVLVAHGFLVLGLALASSLGQWALLVAAIAVAGLSALGTHSDGAADRGGDLRALLAKGGAPMHTVLLRTAPGLLTQIKTLAERPAQSLSRGAAAIALAFAAANLMAAFGFDGRAYPVAIVAMAAISLILAGFYRILSQGREATAPFLATLPLPSRYWMVLDLRFVLALAMLPLALFVLILAGQGFSGLPVIFGLALASLALLGVLRYPVLKGGKRAVFYSVLVTGLWSGAAFAAIPA